MTEPAPHPPPSIDEAYALACDRDDPLRACRDEFAIPRGASGEPVRYFAGNSLGLQPAAARQAVEEALDAWARRGVEGHFDGDHPWYPYHEECRETGASLVGARAGEVVIMNSLTVNLHLMMVSFYRPTPSRYKVLMEYPVFPSDTYAVKTHLRHRGLDPNDALVVVAPRDGEHIVRIEDVEGAIADHGDALALVLLAGVNFFTGQVIDMARISNAAKARGCVMGLDLAHAAGNVPMRLHDWTVDFAVWCSYKYVNGGPGAVGGCYVHESHARNTELPRFGGWWGNDPNARFQMHLQPEFIPRADVDGWQSSNPPILAMAPVRASLALFARVGMDALREKSIRLTGYLRYLIDQLSPTRFEVITPSPVEARGCQLSILVHDRPRELHRALSDADVVCDFREPNIVRVAPVPLYNSFHDVWRFAQVLRQHDEPRAPGRTTTG